MPAKTSSASIPASALAAGRVQIEDVTPQVDGGRHRAKAVVGEPVSVSALVYRDGPDKLAAVVRYRPAGARTWLEAPLAPAEEVDRYEGGFTPDALGRWQFHIHAWTDRYATWAHGARRKLEAGVLEPVDVHEGVALLEGLKLKGAAAKARTVALEQARGAGPDPEAQVRHLLDPTVSEALAPFPDRTGASSSAIFEVRVERERARTGAWYEMFPRSTADGGHGTFATAVSALPRLAELGFDVVYLPPIHPIGTTNRKGRNNSLAAAPDDVGSPWAIGGPEGGHDAVHPDLGTIEDFDAFVAAADSHGLEVALDFAIQCSPDHPWVTEHPEWFQHRPDGTIKHAENPPKKYEDIYPIDFDTEDRQGLWLALKGVIDHWIAHGVRIFRVDNPHTKPLPFWEWLIGSIQDEHPDVVFLAEAFTRPAVMQGLAKLGFSQSYTYFTWRNTKWELQEYLTELADPRTMASFRPNFFVNTPDILHEYLQVGGPPAFKVRLALAALLSPSYGIYSGYELYERVPARAGSEEYLDSEKYELRPREFGGPQTLDPYIQRLNEIRRKNTVLGQMSGLAFHHVDNDSMIAFSKGTHPSDAILVVVNLNPVHWEEATVHLDLDTLGIDPAEPFRVHDLISDATYTWNGPANYVRLDPFQEPAHVFRIQ